MPQVKKFLLLMTATVLLALFSGCWNYREISDLAIVSGVGVDKNHDNGNYILTVELSTPRSSDKGQGGTEPKVLKAEGLTLIDAIRNMVMLSAKRLYWSHAQIVVISEEIAHESLIPELDWLNRDSETRSDISLLISTEKTAGEIFTGIPATEETISYFLNNMLQTQASVSKFPDTEIWEYVSDYRSNIIDPVIPTVRLIEVEGKKVPHIEGTAIMKDDKLVGYLNGEETKYMLFIKNELKGGILPESVEPTTGESRVSLEIFNSKTKIKPKLINNRLQIDIEVKSDISIAEMQSSINYIDSPKREVLENTVEKRLEEKIKQIFEKTQVEYGSDIFGIGHEVQIHKPKYWKLIEDKWNATFANIKINVKADVNIRNSATISKTLEIGGIR